MTIFPEQIARAVQTDTKSVQKHFYLFEKIK